MELIPNIFITLLCLTPTISGAPVDDATAAVQSSPAGISVRVVGSNKVLRVTPTIEFQEEEQLLSIAYTNFKVWSDVTQSFGSKYSSIDIEVVTSEDYVLEIHNPTFEGTYDVAQGGRAQFRAWSYFVSTEQNDIDEVDIDGPVTGDYAVNSITTAPRNQRSACGRNVTFTLGTRLDALGGEPGSVNPWPAPVTIQHNNTTAEFVWIPCSSTSA